MVLYTPERQFVIVSRSVIHYSTIHHSIYLPHPSIIKHLTSPTLPPTPPHRNPSAGPTPPAHRAEYDSARRGSTLLRAY